MRITRAVAAGLALAAAAACQQAPKPLSPADEAAIRAADSSFAVAANAGNVEAMTSRYAADAVVQPPDMPEAAGTEAIRQLWTGLTSQTTANLTLTPGRISGEGNMALLLGSYHLVLAMKDTTQAAPPPEDGKYLIVTMRQADGSWKIVADSWSPNAAPAAPAPVPARRR